MRNKEHVLLSNSTRKPYKDIPDIPEESTYDPILGYWKLKENPLIRSSEFVLASKKCDQETGEDQKGE